jgi:GGDEF domain-containing protein
MFTPRDHVRAVKPKSDHQCLFTQQGDRVLWRLARIASERVAQEAHGDFVGHCGSDDFCLITVPERAESLSSAILDEFDRAMGEMGGGFSSRDVFPSLSIAVVIVKEGVPAIPERIGRFSKGSRPVDSGPTLHPGQVVELGQRLLCQIKADPSCAMRLGRL